MTKNYSFLFCVFFHFFLSGMDEGDGYFAMFPFELQHSILSKQLLVATVADEKSEIGSIPFYWPPDTDISLPIVHCDSPDGTYLTLYDCNGLYVSKLQFQDVHIVKGDSGKYMISEWVNNQGRIVFWKSGAPCFVTKWHDKSRVLPARCKRALVGMSCTVRLQSGSGHTMTITSDCGVWLETLKCHFLTQLVPEKLDLMQYLCLLRLFRNSLPIYIGKSDREALNTLPVIQRLFHVMKHRTKDAWRLTLQGLEHIDLQNSDQSENKGFSWLASFIWSWFIRKK